MNRNTRRRSLSFSPRTHVRNQYEGVNRRTGNFSVNQVNYNVNATGNVDMPGYTMHSPHFIPHSKSSMQVAEAAMAKLREQKNAENNPHFRGVRTLNGVNASKLVTGLSPALSSVPYNGYKPYTNGIANARRNVLNLQNRFGNAWVNATVLRETLNEERGGKIDEIKEKFKADISALEKGFFDATGFVAVTVLGVGREERLRQLDERGLTKVEHDRESARIRDDFDRARAMLPKTEESAFELAMLDLLDKLEIDVANIEKIYSKRFRDEVKVGNPIVRRTQKSLANRLRNANAVAKNN